MSAITSHIHHGFDKYATQFQNKQSCQNESETARSCHMKTATDPRSFGKDTRQWTAELPIRALPPTISHEAKHLLPLRFVEGSQSARCPPAQTSARNFPPHYQKRKIQQNKPPRRNGPRSPASENKHVRTRRAGTSTAGRRRWRDPNSPEAIGVRRRTPPRRGGSGGGGTRGRTACARRR